MVGIVLLALTALLAIPGAAMTPALEVTFHGAPVGLAKCDGGKLLDTVCTPELEPLVPEPARESCPLAPRRQARPPMRD